MPSQLSSPPKPSVRFDDNLNTVLPVGKRSSPVHIYQKIDGCYIRCDILDEKIFDAVVQLKDVDRHRSRYEANLIRTRANRPSEDTARPIVRKKFRSAQAVERSRLAAANNSSASANDSRSLANESIEIPTSNNVVTSDSNENVVTPIERKVRPVHVRSPMPKFIVTKVTEKEKSRETVKFDIRNELKLVRKDRLNTSFDSLKKARELVRKEISDAHMMVQLQRRKSLRIFNAHDDADATDSDPDAFTTNNAELNTIIGGDANRWRPNLIDATNVGSPSTARTVYTVRKVIPEYNRPKTNEQKMELKSKLILHRSSILEACGKIPAHKRVIIEQPQPHKILPAETTDVDSENERNTTDKRRKSLRQRQRSKKVIEAAESEPELTSYMSQEQTKARRSYATDVTDFETDTDGEAILGVKSVKRRRQPNKKYQNESATESKNSASNKQSTSATTPTPKKPRREYKPRQRKTPEKPKASPVKAKTTRESRARTKQSTVDEISDSQKPHSVIEQEPSSSTVAPLPSTNHVTRPPLANMPVFKKSCIGKSKSDVSTKIRTQEMLYSAMVKMQRRYSCLGGSRAPVDILRRVISQREAIYAAKWKGTTQKGKRKRRGRRTTSKKRPNFTKKLLDSPDFSSLIDIARLNEINVHRTTRDDDDDSGSDVGDIEQQLSVIRRGQHLGSLQTMSSPLAHIKLLKAGRSVQTRKTNTEKLKSSDRLITRLPLDNLKNINFLLPIVAANESNNGITFTPDELAKKSIDDAPYDPKPTDIPAANDISSNIVFTNNSDTFDEKANDPFTCESQAKDDDCEIEVIHVPEPPEMVVEHVYDEDDIESPAFEPHLSNGENFQENTDFGAQQLSKTRVRTKRTRGRIRWSKPRKRPPIKHQPVDVATTASISPTDNALVDNEREKAAINKLPPKILNSLPIQRVIAPTTRGRKRQIDTVIAPIITVKSVTQKRGRYTRQETTKTVSLSIEPVNINEM